MRKVIFTALLIIAAWTSALAQIDCEPGKLHQLLTNKAVTSLTISGQMDARDFKYIAMELNALTTVDLSQVEIVAYEDLSTPLMGEESSFAAGLVPSLTFSGKTTLKSIKLPTSATAIGEAAFGGCTSLGSITWPSNLVEVGNYAFTACNALSTITLPASTATIGKGAFMRCKALRQVASTTPTTAQHLTIGAEAFMDCPQLTTVNLASNLTAIGDAAFAGTGLKVVDLSQYKKLASIGNWAYVSNNITGATLAPALKTMGQGAFMYVNTLASVTLPATLEGIDDYTFAGTGALTTVNMGSVTTIGNYAFYSDDAIQELTIPEQVTFIGTQAMAGMTGLKSLFANPTTAPTLGEDVWMGVDQPAVQLVVDRNAFDAYASSEQWKEFKLAYKYLQGDADEDGTLSISDLNIMIDIILGLRTEYPEQTDMDGNGIIDIADVNLLIDSILHLREYTYITVTPNTSDAIIINDFDIAPGETRDIELMLNNREACTDIQCDIILPQGLEIVKTATTDRCKSHTIASTTSDKLTRILCYSTAGQRITGDSGAIVKLTVKASRELLSESTITVNNIALADASRPALFAAASTATVNNTSGIDEVHDAQVVSVRYYNVAGIEASEPFSGINIVVTTYSNGTTSTSKIIK